MRAVNIKWDVDNKEGFDLVVGLCTFPDDDKYYCKYFEVEYNFLLNVLEKLDRFCLRKGVDLENFLENYDWGNHGLSTKLH